MAPPREGNRIFADTVLAIVLGVIDTDRGGPTAGAALDALISDSDTWHRENGGRRLTRL